MAKSMWTQSGENSHWPYVGNDRVKGRVDMVLSLMHALFFLFSSKQPLNGA